MNTKDRKEKQLTLIEFNEEQQAFNFNEDGQTPPREGWMPVAWMPHDEATRFTKRAKSHFGDRRIGMADVIDFYRFDTEPEINADSTYALGYILTDNLIVLAEIAPTYPKLTEAETDAIVTTRNIWSRLLGENVCLGLRSDEFFDLNTLANIRRYFDKAKEAPMIKTALYGSANPQNAKSDKDKHSGFVTFGEMMHRLMKRFSDKMREKKED